MSKNPKKMRRNINKVLCLVVAAFIATSLGAMGMAVAQTVQDASCPNHTEHDDTCGYGAAAEEIPCDMDCETASDEVIVHAEGCAYTAATEGSDCTHSCELCDPTSITLELNTPSGVSLYPGTTSNDYDKTYAHTVNVYNHDADGLMAMVSIASGNEDLTDYDVVVEIPKEGKEAIGTLLDESGTSGTEARVASQIDMRLTGAATVQGGAITVYTVTYRINDAYYSESEVGSRWSDVDAIRIQIPEFPSDSELYVTFSMDMDTQEASMDGASSYLAATYSYSDSNSLNNTGDQRSTLGVYTFHTYTLSGVVWYDPNEDGTRGSSETVLSGVALTLKDGSGDTVATATTDSNGEFSFTKITNGQNLYIEISLDGEYEGYKLTAQSSETDMTASATDSDFNRETNILTLPTVLRNGTYTNISAGLVKLPVIDAPAISVAIDGTAAATASVQWDYEDYGYGTATLHYEQAYDTEVAVVDASNGTVTGVEEGETKAIVWVENTLGDRVEAEYTILVGITAPVSFTLKKTLTEAADSDETFVFQITDINGNSFYATLTVAEGETSASVKVVDLTPGEYTVRELNTNWRYRNTGSEEQTETLDDADTAYTFTFASSKMTSQWVSGSAKARNTMGEQQQ